MLHLHDLVSSVESLYLCRTVLLNACDENAHVVSSSKTQANTITLLEAHHLSVGAVGDYSLEPPSCLNILVSNTKRDLCTCEKGIF